MPNIKGKQKGDEGTISDSQIDYTFEEKEENPFVRKPRIAASPIVTRSKSRLINVPQQIVTIDQNQDIPAKSIITHSKDTLKPYTQPIQVAKDLTSSFESVASSVNMANENEGMNTPVAGSHQPQSGIVSTNDLSDLTTRLEHVLTSNHNTFMSEISTLRHILVENSVRNSNNSIPPGGNPNSAGTSRNNMNNNSFHNESLNSDSGRNSSYSEAVRLDKWNVTYDGTDDVDDFLFKVDTLKNRWHCSDDYLAANFHTLLKGKADKWFWSFLKQHPNTKYGEIKYAMTKQFSKLENDCDKLVRLIERRQLYKESFDDYFSAMVSMNSRLAQPMSDAKLIDLIRNNVKESLGSLLFGTDLFSLEHLRDTARRAEKFVIKQQQIRFQKKQISELLEEENSKSESEDNEEEVSALRYQSYQKKEGKQLDTSHYKCWNCDQIGHSFYDCPSEKRNLFCFRCGEKNVATPQCKKHAENGNRCEQMRVPRPPAQIPQK